MCLLLILHVPLVMLFEKKKHASSSSTIFKVFLMDAAEESDKWIDKRDACAQQAPLPGCQDGAPSGGDRFRNPWLALLRAMYLYLIYNATVCVLIFTRGLIGRANYVLLYECVSSSSKTLHQQSQLTYMVNLLV